MTKKQNKVFDTLAKTLAEPVVKSIVNCMAKGKYQDILKYAEFESDTVESFQEAAEGYLKLNHLSHFDKYDTPCSFQPHYKNSNAEYQQFTSYFWKNGKGFSVDYDLTTDGKLNDLTLQVDFFFQKDHTLRAVITDIHVL